MHIYYRAIIFRTVFVMYTFKEHCNIWYLIVIVKINTREILNFKIFLTKWVALIPLSKISAHILSTRIPTFINCVQCSERWKKNGCVSIAGVNPLLSASDIEIEEC